MDLSNPLRSVAPSVDADVLRVLAGSHAWLTGAGVARLANRSYAGVRAVLHRLVDHGLVEHEAHGSAVSYRLNRDHVLADAVETIVQGSNRIEHSLADDVASWDPEVHALVVYGSFARRDGDSQSDIDLMLVRPDTVDPDDERWYGQRHAFAKTVERWTGNTAQIIELSAAELAQAVDDEAELIASLRREARVLVGPELSELVGSERRFA